MLKLSQNKGTLKYKEYCKALIDDFNQAFYKSNYQKTASNYLQSSGNKN
jgi:hypothetical protein